MASDIVKVKAKKDYEWRQDNKCVYINLTIPNTSVKKIDIYLSDLILRVTSLERKSTHTFDLYAPINYQSHDNKNIYANNTLYITLVKETSDMWPELLCQLPMAQLKERRKESEKRYEMVIQKIEEDRQKLRTDYDRKATQELMRFEQEQRDKLERRKELEKSEALQQIYKDITEDGRIEKQEKIVKDNQPVDQAALWEAKEKLAIQLLEKEEEQERMRREQAHRSAEIAQHRRQNAIFTEQEVQDSEAQAVLDKEEFEEIPVRQATNVGLKFTEKPIPHLAAREQHFLQPPMPKQKYPNKSDKNKIDDMQQRNPLWLKDKGDLFLKNRDYVSAIDAYKNAIEKDSNFLPAYLNRSVCHLKLFNISECLADCESAEKILQATIAEEGETKNKKIMAKIIARKAICLAWRGDFTEARGQFELLLGFDGVSEQDKTDITQALDLIERRQKSNSTKLAGDLDMKKGNYSQALATYDEAYSIDSNQYASSNRAQAYLKLEKPLNAIEECDKALQSLSGCFQLNQLVKFRSSSCFEASKILIKVYYRKALALKQLGRSEEALKLLRNECAGLTDSDKDVLGLIKQIEADLNREQVKQLKQEAADFLKAGKFEQALQKYSDCLKILDQSQVLEYLAILQNRCVCFLSMKRYDDIIATAVRSLKIIHNQQNRLVAFDGSKVQNNNAEHKQKLLEFEVRILVRRANAYMNLGQVYNGKSDLERALQLDPTNQKVKADLDKLVAAMRLHEGS